MADQKPDFSAGIPAAALDQGAIVAGTVDGEAVVLVRHQGKVCAVSGECTHLGAPLETGIVASGELRCPWHHARFALATGEAVGAPAMEPLSCYDVVEEDGTVRVTGKRGVRQPEEVQSRGGPILIVGGGAAGHACADMLARAGQGGRVTLLSADRDAPYDRTFCSKQYLAGKKERADCLLPEPGQGEGAPVAIRTGVEVASIDLERRIVTTGDGEDIAYDTLILATGAEPTRPDIEGLDHPNARLLRTLADADGLIAAADTAKHVAIMGASFIGLEVAASLVQRKLSVTVIAQDDIPLAAILGPEAGRFVQSLHEDKGVRFQLGRTIARYDGTVATLDDGSTVEADLLVIGVGVEPRVDLAEKAGIVLATEEEGGGIRVDETMATSAETIFAIGDVANYPDPRLGHRIRVEHWVHAQRQGQYLARRLLGETNEGFGDTPFFWSGHYDVSLRYVGHVASPDDRRVEGAVEQGEFAIFFREDGEEQALLTGKRDIEALDVEAAWDRPASA
ncbi:FAD-dependent oxidoreductase [Sphingomonas abietis]|uniref:FAD-dependent oxidoreductase n=1 Tax=Sphingomonas abietis TaxID=3012344 RepID=A0ABY7NIQ3_9SPHN|nr:FAD-dependent oxidoreductase [Sphingomonas abietis]WBO21368.1 FAD-dependent oxidoreductase [Sphingomonas abietis]